MNFWIIIIATLYLLIVPVLGRAPKQYWSVLTVGWVIGGIILGVVCAGVFNATL